MQKSNIHIVIFIMMMCEINESYSSFFSSSDKASSGHNRYVEFNQNFSNQVADADLRLAKLNKLKSVPKDFPGLARLAVETHSAEIDALIKNAHSFWPTTNIVSLSRNPSTNKKEIICVPSFFSSNKTLYTKGPDISRIITALEMRKAIDLNNLKHIAIANKSFVKDPKDGWIVVAQGVVGSKLPCNERDYAVVNSLTVDEIEDLIKLAEETGFTDWQADNINMVRDQNNNNKLTIIDTERQFLMPVVVDNTALDACDMILGIKEHLGMNDTSKKNGLHLHDEVKNYIENKCSMLEKQQQPERFKSLLSKNHRYKIAGLNLEQIENEFETMNESCNNNEIIKTIMSLFRW